MGTPSQKKAMGNAVRSILGKKYNLYEAGLPAAFDWNIFYCKCCKKTRTTKDKLDGLFVCSTAAAYLLQAIGILNEWEPAEEYMPGDYGDGWLKAHCIGGQEFHGPTTMYGKVHSE